jgi:hypothetical protein
MILFLKKYNMGNNILKNMFGKNNYIKAFKRILNRKGGQASLEFALIVPFVVLIILVVSHIGLLIYQKNILEQASREGARVIATTNSIPEAYGCIRDVCSGLDQERLNISIDPGNMNLREVGDMVTVILSYKYSGFTDMIAKLTGKDIFIKAKSSMRMECY